MQQQLHRDPPLLICQREVRVACTHVLHCAVVITEHHAKQYQVEARCKTWRCIGCVRINDALGVEEVPDVDTFPPTPGAIQNERTAKRLAFHSDATNTEIRDQKKAVALFIFENKRVRYRGETRFQNCIATRMCRYAHARVVL